MRRRRGRLRVLVTLDPSASSESALDAVRSLAAGREAAIEGLLIEDMNLHRLARLPFARQITHATGTLEPIDPGRLERQLRAQAEGLRRQFEETASRLRLRSSFRVGQGEADEQVRLAARQVDLLVVSHTARSSTWQGPTARRLAAEQNTTVVLLRGSWRTGTSVAALFDHAEHTAALETARRIAEEGDLGLVVLLPPESGPEAEELERQARSLLGESASEVRYLRLPGVEPHQLAGAAHDQTARALVLPAAFRGSDEEAACRLLEQLDCTLILVR